MPIQRYRLTIAYRGTRYHGWQAQPAMETWTGERPPKGHGIPTVQESIARALTAVVRHSVELVGSSRTDSGVHAKGQIAHFDTDQVQIPKEGIRKAINHHLPSDILVRAIDPVPQTFNARMSTTSKRYQYFIWNAADRPVFFSDMAWHRWQKLDVKAMQQAASYFVGRHDFASFARPGHGRDYTVRTIFSCDVTCRPPKLIIGVEGSGFLWNMVRIMVGTLVQVGIYRYPPEKIIEMLEARDRKSSGPTAPPHGLYLQWIKTKKEDEVPAEAAPLVVEQGDASSPEAGAGLQGQPDMGDAV
ncbi:MAG TPA: tRNA pseudouridine(38-40) synthase TruA [Tepidisphaeraceae bacterium]|nr:tRNA pseudouridine(38-40) synthase TruA [Tepidisphaeraceae bacterium]